MRILWDMFQLGISRRIKIRIFLDMFQFGISRRITIRIFNTHLWALQRRSGCIRVRVRVIVGLRIVCRQWSSTVRLRLQVCLPAPYVPVMSAHNVRKPLDPGLEKVEASVLTSQQNCSSSATRKEWKNERSFRTRKPAQPSAGRPGLRPLCFGPATLNAP